MQTISNGEICTPPTSEPLVITVDKNKENSQIVSIMETLIKENQEFKKLMIEQNSQIMEIAKNPQ